MAFDTNVIDKNIDLGNGNKFIIEKHTYDGEDFFLRYEAGSGADVDANLTTHNTSFWQELADAELIEVIDG